MARKKDLGSKLSGKPAGWQDQVTGRATPQETPSEAPSVEPAKPTYLRKTYLMTPELVQRIEDLAAEERVGINELVRHLLDMSLTQIERGEHTLEKKPVQQYKLD